MSSREKYEKGDKGNLKRQRKMENKFPPPLEAGTVEILTV
jgi:hypothetical protein